MREIIGTIFRPMRVVYIDISLTLITVAVSYLLPAYPMFWRLPVVMQCAEYSPHCKTSTVYTTITKHIITFKFRRNGTCANFVR